VSVVVVLDGPVRHHSKKARAARVTEVEQARFDALIMKKELMRNIDLLHNSSALPTIEVNTMNSTILTLEEELQKREKKFNENAALPTNFVESVQHEVDNVRRDLGDTEVTVSVVEAVTQADCVICYHAVRGNVDGALANDGDFIAVTGRNMMLIKEFKIKKGWKRTSRSHDDALSNVMVAIGYKDKFQSDVLDKLSLDAVPTYTDLKVKKGHRLAPHPLFFASLLLGGILFLPK
jgi:hypothetical protein